MDAVRSRQVVGTTCTHFVCSSFHQPSVVPDPYPEGISSEYATNPIRQNQDCEGDAGAGRRPCQGRDCVQGCSATYDADTGDRSDPRHPTSLASVCERRDDRARSIANAWKVRSYSTPLPWLEP